MNRYIDKDALTAEFKRLTLGENSLIERVFADGVYAVIDTFPTADVVEVVRCKDCKHLEIINDGKVYAKCTMTDFEFLPFGTDTREHYCGYGKKKRRRK